MKKGAFHTSWERNQRRINRELEYSLKLRRLLSPIIMRIGNSYLFRANLCVVRILARFGLPGRNRLKHLDTGRLLVAKEFYYNLR